MRKITLFLLMYTGMAYVASAQPQPLLLTEPVHRQTRIRVITNVKDTLLRTAEVSTFRLRSGEDKAVTTTGTDIVKVSPGISKLFADTFKKARIFVLPELYFALEEGTNAQISYRILFIDSAPLRYNFDKGEFEGIIRFLPVETVSAVNEKPVEKRLSVDEEIQVLYGTTTIPVKITQINWPPQNLKISTSDALDSLEVKILTQSNPLGYSKKLRVEPAIILSSNRNVIQGFGLQTTPLYIVLKGVSSYRPVPLYVEASRGSIQSPNLTLSGDKPGEVVLRSENIGEINLHIVNPNYRSNSISIKSVFPWLFVLMALLGGLIGGVARKLSTKERITSRSIILGCLFGLIAAFAYWGLGIKLIYFSFAARGLNESMVFALSLIAGLYGLKLKKK
jgi:hypothetical protein